MIINQITEFRLSNAAYNLLGGPRLGTVGWNKKYWDHGERFDANGKPINQAHHFAASFIDALKVGPKRSSERTSWLDEKGILGDKNLQDVALSKTAINLAARILNGQLSWKELPNSIYRELK